MRSTVFSLPLLLALALFAGACVNVDPKTNQIIPRGEQRYEFSVVKEKAKGLKAGMSKYDCLLMLGSPAENNKRDDTWVYLPERPAVVVPGRALRLQFKDGYLVDHGYHAIVLGQRL